MKMQYFYLGSDGCMFCAGIKKKPTFTLDIFPENLDKLFSSAKYELLTVTTY